MSTDSFGKMRPIQLLSSVVFILCLKSFLCQRRLTGGKETNADKGYMVYIVQSYQSSKFYDNWLCGGALISAWQVLTSATCLMEVSHVYVIAGYKKYVNGRALEYDECTRTRKNRVMKTCVPKDYKLYYNNRSGWMTFDIAVAFVEKRYDFRDQSWLDHCSYIPRPIRISYDSDVLKEGTDVVAFGWGGSNFRIQTDILDNNAPYLREIASLIAEKNICKEKFDGGNARTLIDEHMICVSGVGNLDGEGNMQNIGSTSNNGCGRRSGNSSGCNGDEMEYRRKSGAFDKSKESVSKNLSESKRYQPVPSRRQALCQNDHGGPLITWIGSEEVLIGVACSSIVDEKSLICLAPSLFTSMYCTGKIVECLIGMTKARRRRCAEGIKSDGIDIEDNNVDWGT